MRSGTHQWYRERNKRLNPLCQHCGLPFGYHTCTHETVFYPTDCHSDKHFTSHACPNPDNPLGIALLGRSKRSKVKAPPKPHGEYGWFQGQQYQDPTTRPNRCDNCGGQDVAWWGGYRICQGCLGMLKHGVECQFEFDPDILRGKLHNLFALDSSELDQVAHEVERIYGENEYRRMSRDEDIRWWIWNSRAYAAMMKDHDPLVLSMTNITLLIQTMVSRKSITIST